MKLELDPRQPRGWLAICACAIALCGGCGDDAGGDDEVDEPDAGAPLQLVFQDLDAALMSVQGTSSTDVWTVGADMHDGDGALVLHFDGERWTRHLTAVETDLWWVHAQAEDSVWMVGRDGTIIHYDGDGFTQMETPGSDTVFGIWGAAPDDVWAVGGEPEVAPGFVWHYDGESWSNLTSMLPEAVQGPALFKVWGQSANDIWIVGMDGIGVHWDGSAFEQADMGTERRLFTVHGPPGGDSKFVAVGGQGDAVIVEYDGTEWHNITPDPAPQELFGVFMESATHGYAVGYEGSILERTGSAWKLLETRVELFNPFHAVWIDPDGGVWAVGGDVESPAPSEGMLLHRGKVIPDEIEN